MDNSLNKTSLKIQNKIKIETKENRCYKEYFFLKIIKF